MSYNWKDEANKAFDAPAKVLAGQQWLRIEDIITGGKNGPFQTDSGVPKIMLVFRDNEKRECVVMYTLSEKAGMFLAKLMSRLSPALDLDALSRSGITPQSMAEPEIATQYIKGRYVFAEVSWEKGSDGNLWPKVTPMRSDETIKFDHPIPERKKRTEDHPGAFRNSSRSTSPQGTHVAVDDDSIPF